MSVMRCVVFDTSTLVSAALRVGSIPHRALSLALSEGDVCISAATLAELEQVLLRQKFDSYQPTEVRAGFVALVRRNAHLFAVSEAEEAGVVPACRDPKDSKFLALSRVCDAAALICSDADLLVMNPWQGIPIITPAKFVELVGA